MLLLLLLPLLLCSNIAIIKMVVGVNEMCVFGSVKAENFSATFSHTILMPFLLFSLSPHTRLPFENEDYYGNGKCIRFILLVTLKQTQKPEVGKTLPPWSALWI